LSDPIGQDPTATGERRGVRRCIVLVETASAPTTLGAPGRGAEASKLFDAIGIPS
jgi:hypothetical protein